MLLQGFHGGVANHDTFVGENQVAYAENVHLTDPEFVTLSQKPENYALTDNDLVLTKLELEYNGHAYMGTQSGKMYDKGNNVVLCTTAFAQPITNIFSRYSHIYWSMGSSRMGRIDSNYLINGPSRVSGNLEAQGANYSETYKTSTGDFIVKLQEISTSKIMAITFSEQRTLDNSLVATSLVPTAGGVLNGLRVTLNYWKIFSHRGYMTYTDGSSTQIAAGKDYDSFYIEAIQANDQEFMFSSLKSDSTNVFVPSGEGKALIAQARTSGPDNRPLHYYGRKTNPLSVDARYRQVGTDTHGGYNNIAYMINNNGIMCYGSTVPGMPKAWFYINRNYNGDLIDEVGMVKVETQSNPTNNYLYYSWRVGSSCGVDRIDLDKIGNPDTYQENGYIYTPKYNFGENKAFISKIKLRADTNTGQTIKVYASVDGGDRELRATLAGTNQKKYQLIGNNEEAYTIQWKLELETDDDTKTPKLYAMSFIPTIGSHE